MQPVHNLAGILNPGSPNTSINVSNVYIRECKNGWIISINYPNYQSSEHIAQTIEEACETVKSFLKSEVAK